jgi:predicted dehydrogenase
LIQVAVLGAGHWGPNLIRNFHYRGRSCVRRVVDLDQARLRAVHERYPEVLLSTDPADVFTDDRVDAVVIATPTASHAELVRQALRAGKHVLVEKPLTDGSASAHELCRLAERAGRVLLVGHVFLYNPAVQWIKERIDSGAMGRIYHLSSTRTNLGPVRIDVNAAWDLAAQDIAIFNHWLGSPPLGVSALGHDWINPGVEDAVFATLRYPDQVLANVHASWLNPRKVRTITIVADRQMLTYDDLDQAEPVRLHDKRVTDQRVSTDFVDTFAGFRSIVHSGDVTIPSIRMGEPLLAECMHFLDCIENGTPVLTDGAQGLAVIAALEALDRSMAQGGTEEPVRSLVQLEAATT